MAEKSKKINKEETTKRSKASSLWGSRFNDGPSAIMDEINPSIEFDQRFFSQDIEASRVHARMLARQRIISKKDGDNIIQGLDEIEGEIRSGEFVFRRDLEDIHMNIEARLSDLIGEAGGRLHTGRSRNDQVATDFKMWVRDKIDRLDKELERLQEALINRADENVDVVMPGFTHLQVAQPVTFGHHLLAYVEMFGRDRGRFRDCRVRLNECPLGSAALAGTSFPIDREFTALALGFDKPTANSLDSVSDRDFALEFLSVVSICAVHLSRLAEEIINWNSVQFGFVSLSDQFTTGSSIMPQKRNPDAAELIRGKSGRVIGALNALLIMMKGLPLAFCKDMQEDKEPLFDACDTIEVCLAACTGMILDMKTNESKMREAADSGFSTATDLADWLVRVLDIPFRKAHHLTGSIVKLAEHKECRLKDLTLQDLQKIESSITELIFSVLDPVKSVSSRKSFGGTAPSNVQHSVLKARERFIRSTEE
ncbi:MAG: argininosuccinate lyase [Rhodospirillaceae bacterium]|nr:argininosuccinate lyase [Rhodospirillaceae bacterium]|tara:strand:- start:2682 stop:4127 length:1446 start_codon:yes stop_codon:yes gene_type:complete